MVEGVIYCTLDFDFFEHFIYGKQNRILELVHNDVFGHVHVPSLGRSMYYVSFIYDLSRNTWIYFVRRKSEVFAKFK